MIVSCLPLGKLTRCLPLSNFQIMLQKGLFFQTSQDFGGTFLDSFHALVLGVGVGGLKEKNTHAIVEKISVSLLIFIL